ncbi:hypothetical protein BX070DRAFT_72277 [Coemansia spiralis]|nr:hypothetical protein BX070DRAFT_72277 [Coemansia spiralis]
MVWEKGTICRSCRGFCWCDWAISIILLWPDAGATMNKGPTTRCLPAQREQQQKQKQAPLDGRMGGRCVEPSAAHRWPAQAGNASASSSIISPLKARPSRQPRLSFFFFAPSFASPPISPLFLVLQPLFSLFSFAPFSVGYTPAIPSPQTLGHPFRLRCPPRRSTTHLGCLAASISFLQDVVGPGAPEPPDGRPGRFRRPRYSSALLGASLVLLRHVVLEVLVAFGPVRVAVERLLHPRRPPPPVCAAPIPQQQLRPPEIQHQPPPRTGDGPTAAAFPPLSVQPPSSPTAIPQANNSNHHQQMQMHQHQQKNHYNHHQQLPSHHAATAAAASSSSSSSSAFQSCQCKCSQCDPNYYTIPLHLLFAGEVEYVCRDCQFSTLSYQTVQDHEGSSGHRRWYNYPQYPQ